MAGSRCNQPKASATIRLNSVCDNVVDRRGAGMLLRKVKVVADKASAMDFK
jgi:hypothetical protein